MARSAKHPCRKFGCRTLLVKPGYCDQHKPVVVLVKKAALDPEYQERNRFYQRVAWKRIRKAQLDREPLCRGCKEKNKLEPASIVDHIKPIALGGDALSLDNLQSLCVSCHNRKTRRDTNK